jgi:hypothetical protein
MPILALKIIKGAHLLEMNAPYIETNRKNC